MCIGLVLLAYSTALNILPHELGETWPLKFGGNKLVSLEIPGMPSSFMIVAAGEDGVAERVLQGNIDMALVSQDVIIIFPVREMRSEGSGDVFQR